MFSPRLLSGVTILFICATPLSAEKPFDFESTPGKLPKQVVPEEYSVRIKPDLEKLTFTGWETIKLKARQAVRRLVLNALDLRIMRASLDGKAIPESALKLDPKQETLTITLASELPEGAHSLELDFTGKINQRGQGLYYARYQGQPMVQEEEKKREDDEEREKGKGRGQDKDREENKDREKASIAGRKIMLGTQFEPTDARRFFPCWDEPSFRARFQLTVIIPENFLAISNMPVEKETKGADGKEVRFAYTPPMASYLNV